MLTASRDGTAKVWQLGSGEFLGALEGHGDAARSTVFSQSGPEALTTSIARAAKIWRAGSDKCLRNLEGHGDRVVFAASPRLAARETPQPAPKKAHRSSPRGPSSWRPTRQRLGGAGPFGSGRGPALLSQEVRPGARRVGLLAGGAAWPSKNS